MKNFFTLLLFCCLFLSCSDDTAEATFENPKVASTTSTSTSTFANNPEANSEFDNSYKGIYKGIVTGAVSGVLHVNILNDGNIVARFKTEDNKSYVLENVTSLDVEGENTFSIYKNYRFANELMSFELRLDENGNNITTSNFFFFSNNSSKICLLKEKSNSLLKCYVGKFNGPDETGSINFITDGLLKVHGLSKKSNSPQTTSISGEINLVNTMNEAIRLPNGGGGSDNDSSTLYYQLNANLHLGQIKGYLKRNKFEGNWVYEENELGSWNASRML